MKTTAALTLVIVAALYVPAAYADTFGNGANTFDIEFVRIGDPDNPDDTTGAPNPVGKVEYAYRIGKFEISEDMVNKANTLGGLGITHSNRGANKPATDINWFEAARFVNWLNTSTGHTPAYKFNGSAFELWQPGDAGYNPANLFRNTQAFYFLPSVDEWYKAAFYDPTAGVYYDFATGSNSVPDGIDFAGDPMFDTVFFDGGTNGVPNDITNVGVFSPYGTAGQGGNAQEWEETETDLLNNSVTSSRALRGGDWGDLPDIQRATHRSSNIPSLDRGGFGFRVASLPEPSTALLGAMAAGGVLVWRRRPR